MRPSRLAPFILLISLPSLALAQSTERKSSDEVAPSEAQKAFEILKTLAGSWEGPVILDPLLPGMTEQPINGMHVTIRVTSRGNAIVHEMHEAKAQLDPSRDDHPVTMFYLDADQLNLVHYCDAGNRPRMTGRLSPDGKSVEFEFVDLSGGNEHGHMHRGVFTIIDANHHIEDWTYMLPGDKPIHAHAELKRTNAGSDTSGY